MAAPIIWDRGVGIWDTGRRALLAGIEMGATHHLVLQDDVILSEGLSELLPLLTRPGCVCLYAGNQVAAKRAMALARHHGYSWFRYGDVVYGPAVMVPVSDLQPLVAYGDASSIRSYDTRIRDYYRHLGQPAWYTAPSLVEHRHGNNPSIKGNRDDRHSSWFGSGQGIDWSGEALMFDAKALQPLIEMTDGTRTEVVTYRGREYYRLMRLPDWRPTAASQALLGSPLPPRSMTRPQYAPSLTRQTVSGPTVRVRSRSVTAANVVGAGGPMVRIKMRMHLPEARIGEEVDMDEERAARLVAKNWATYVEEDQPYISEGPRPVGAAARVDIGASGYAWRDEPEPLGDDSPPDDRPSGNSSEDEWRTYRLAHGYTEDELAGLGRNKLRELEDR
jgi:hypothetical protein